MKKYICIHGHFYQPPRENAWLEIIERQPSAQPFHDWNERIDAECYGPNAVSRILNEEKKIVDITNNYENISFNFGPTLMSWLEVNDIDTYKAILQADRNSQVRFEGHGNAIAQVYNHMIMPLANAHDKMTQVIWGIEDFKSRFGRKPEGMWLAETAANTETLECLAANKIRFTILAPRQAKAFKKLSDTSWTQVINENDLDSTRPYLCRLPSGNSIVIFFYNGKIARDVAFNGLLNSGAAFAERLAKEFDDKKSEAQLVHIATDGETYGHHHKRGDMALASCIKILNENPSIEIVNYGYYLAHCELTHEIQIAENTSWSCVHGVERWRSNCGCTDGAHPAYHQLWREPLRNALNRLRDQLAVIFESEMRPFTNDPWQLRNEYIAVVLNRDEKFIREFLNKFFGTDLNETSRSKILRMLEMQRNAMLMFTSCAWFFEEVSRIEARQILSYADRAIQIAEHETSVNLYDEFVRLLSLAPSNVPSVGNAGLLFESEIHPQRITLTKVGIHHAILSLFDFEPALKADNYILKEEFLEKFEVGEMRFAAGKFDLRSVYTNAKEKTQFAALRLGQHHVICGCTDNLNDDEFEELYLQGRQAFRSGKINKVIELIEIYFGDKKYSFDDVFKEEQQQVLNSLLESELEESLQNFNLNYGKNYALLSEMKQKKIAIPELLKKNLELSVNASLIKLLSADEINFARLDSLVKDVNSWSLSLFQDEISKLAAKQLLNLVILLEDDPSSIKILDSISRLVISFSSLQIKYDLWKIQNIYFAIAKSCLGNSLFKSSTGEAQYQKWKIKFKAVAEQLDLSFQSVEKEVPSI